MMLQKKQHASTASLLGVILTFLALLVAWQSPLLSTPTVEAALFLGMFLAPISFMSGVSRGAHLNPAGFVNDVSRELAWIGIPVLFYLLIVWIHSLGTESCSSAGGIFPFILILGPQLLLCVASGIGFGRIIGRPQLANFLGLLLIPTYLIFQGFSWWMNPSMRFFDMYWFLVGGDLLSGQSLEPAIVIYRLAALSYALMIIALGIQWKKHATKFWVVMFFLVSGLTLHVQGYRQLSPALAQRKIDYPDVLSSGPFTLHTNFALVPRVNAEGVLQEAQFWYQRLQQRTGLHIGGQTHIWLYENGQSLAKYTGAKHVHFTLPAHREIHISSIEIPHPTLGHEIAHVILAEASTTIWGVPGIWGFLPNWGLSEGLATYLTPELAIRDDLTFKEQAVALFKLGLEPEPWSLMDSDPWSFWMQSSPRAYAISAAFLEDLISKQCHTESCRSKMLVKIAKFGELYLTTAQKKSVVVDWGSFELPPDALPCVSKTFASNSILTAVCRNGVQISTGEKPKTREQEADQLVLEGRFQEAFVLYEQIPLLEQPLYKQRELIIKKALLSSTNYAKSGLELLVQKPENFMAVAAAYGKLGYTLKSPCEADMACNYATYLLSRAEILSGDFSAGLGLMPKSFDGPVGIESMRLIGLAKAQLGSPEEAAALYQDLATRSSRSANTLMYTDLAERALGMARGHKYLLGVWTKTY